MSRASMWVAFAVACVGFPARSWAVGQDGPPGAPPRWGAGAGAGWDHVGGHGRDGYAFLELYAHAQGRVWRQFAMAADVSLRRDVLNYNYALERTREGAFGVAARVWFGFDGASLHISVAPWLYGDNRDGRRFRASVLPYGGLRVRVGSTEGWHVRFGLLDGVAYTAEGAGTAARLLVGAPVRGRHRVAAGLYTSLGEYTAGVAVVDEVSALGPAGMSVRVGGLLGSDIGHLGSRPEMTLFMGFVH